MLQLEVCSFAPSFNAFETTIGSNLKYSIGVCSKTRITWVTAPTALPRTSQRNAHPRPHLSVLIRQYPSGLPLQYCKRIFLPTQRDTRMKIANGVCEISAENLTFNGWDQWIHESSCPAFSHPASDMRSQMPTVGVSFNSNLGVLKTRTSLRGSW